MSKITIKIPITEINYKKKTYDVSLIDNKLAIEVESQIYLTPITELLERIIQVQKHENSRK